MRKIASVILAAAVASSAAVISAYAETDVTLTLSEAGLQTSYNEGNGNAAVLCFYDNGKLVYSSIALPEDGKYTFEADEKYYDNEARISYIGGETYDAVIDISSAPSESETPSESAAPTETASPNDKPVQTDEPTQTASPSQVPEQTDYPEIYQKATDAINAPMIVTENDAAMVDGEMYYNLTVLYQGREAVISVKDSVEINSAPDNASYLIGRSAESLQEGDVIHMNSYLSGGIKSLNVIYRPEKTDYINSDNDGGEDFKELYSSAGKVAGSWTAMSYGNITANGDGYIFGVPVETKDKYILLANKEGKIKEINILPETIVYTINNAARSDKAEFTGFGYSAIEKTFVQNNDFYESLVDWTDVEDITYALVRIIDGVATDIVVLTNN